MNEWDKSRLYELGELEMLLREVSAIDSGNNCLERIKKCIDLAHGLSWDNVTSGRPGFVGWLKGMALESQDKKNDP